MGLRDRERRRLPGEYDLDLDRDRDRERLWEERDLLRLLERDSEPHQMHQAPQQGPGFHAQPCRSFPHLPSSWDSPQCTLPGLRAWIGPGPRAGARSGPRVGARWFWRSWIGAGGGATSAFRPTARPRRAAAQTEAEKLLWNSLEMPEQCKYASDQTEITHTAFLPNCPRKLECEKNIFYGLDRISNKLQLG